MTSQDSYWIRRLQSGRVSRRRFVGGAALAGVGAASLGLVGCGDDDSSSGGQATPRATASGSATVAAAKPKTGGTLTVPSMTDPATFDPFTNLSYNSQEFAGSIYSRLLKPKTGEGIAPAQLVVAPDLALSHEIPGDGLTVTFKLRPDVKFHDTAPVNGRAFTAEDAKFSFDRYLAMGQQRTAFAAVDRVETPDASTLVFKLKTPSAAFLTYVTWGSYVWIMPKETIGANNKHAEGPPHIGTGPYIFDQYTPGTSASFKKNPNYFLPGQPYIDELRRIIVPDSSTIRANFRSGQIDALNWNTAIGEPDIDSVRKANPKATYGEFPSFSLESFYFGEKLSEPPFNDPRVRQAISMAMDRDALLQVSANGKGEWSTMFPAKFSPWWLDPRGKEFGPNAKYFKYDVKAAKELMTGAGHANGLDADLNVTFDYGAEAKERYELVAAMLKDIGIRVALKSKEYAAYQSTTSLGKFSGLAYGPYAVYPDPDGFLATYWLSSSPRRKSIWVDPQLDALITKQSTTFDAEQRKQAVWDIQRHVAEKGYAPGGVNGTSYVAHQPWVKNYYHSIDYGAPSNSVVNAWIDRA